jgi:hypothetical protein
LKVGEAETEKSAKNIVNATVASCAPLAPLTVRLKGLRLDAESPLTVRVLLWVGVIDDGSKEQVTPNEQASTMLSTKELGAEAKTVKVTEVVPIAATVDLALAERENTGVPPPVSATVCGLPAASSVTLRVPLRGPLPSGVKVTDIVQKSPTLRKVGKAPQVLV